ncbi:MAG TPA: BTAD domain-containing putative transcriptional regulator [Clostridia bacterium]|nr:BTAD domain-containing putative transcriptional regulator [Clostridia bacterium]
MGNDRPRIRISLLCKLEVQINGKRVDGVFARSRNMCRLIAFLLLQKGESVPVTSLYEALWPGNEITNPENALKTLVSRTRALLVEVDPQLRQCIQARRGAYGWNMELAGDVDAFEVERLCRDIVACKEMDQAMGNKLDRLLCLYAGPLLPECTEEAWVSDYAQKLDETYRSAIYWALELLKQADALESLVKVCRMSLVIMPMDDRLHEELMQALIQMNRRNDAMSQYMQLAKLHRQHLGTPPSERMQAIYREIVRKDQIIEADLDRVRGELLQDEERSGAFVCEYPIFKLIYRLQLRSLERYNLSSFLAMIRISNPYEEEMDPIVLDETMQTLLKQLKSSLRKGDTITRYSASQYALLLQGVTQETAKIIMDRIKLIFFRETRNVCLNLDYCYAPLKTEEQTDS